MKKIIITSAMFFTLLQAKAQQEKQIVAATSYMLPADNTVIKDNLSFNLSNDLGYRGPSNDYDSFMKKKKNNLTAGLVTLSAGLVISGIGLITLKNSNGFENDSNPGVLFVVGAASGIVSIPLMIMATVYSHKARLELKNQKTGFGVPANVSNDITGITLTIPIGK